MLWGWFACNLILKIVVFKDYAEYFSVLHRQSHSPANDLNTIMCQTRKPNVRVLFIFLMFESIPHLFQTNTAFDAAKNRAESFLVFWHVANPQ